MLNKMSLYITCCDYDENKFLTVSMDSVCNALPTESGGDT